MDRNERTQKTPSVSDGSDDDQKTELTERLAFEVYAAQERARGLTPLSWEKLCATGYFAATHEARAAAVRVIELLELGIQEGGNTPDVAERLARSILEGALNRKGAR